MRYQGRITNWKDEQGFGFITPNGGGNPVFVHVKAFANRQKRPVGNEIVTYEITTDARGRVQAKSVAFVGTPARSTTSSGTTTAPILLAVLFLAFVAGASLVGKLPLAVPGLYLLASIIAFCAYAGDKSAARNDQWRTQESTLHLLALLGGWPGALAAQRLRRHKSKKASFQMVFWATVVLNCAALGCLFSAPGGKALASILGAV